MSDAVRDILEVDHLKLDVEPFPHLVVDGFFGA